MGKKREIVKVFGIVQGVGFRPFIHKLVIAYGLKGWVQNNASGVVIDIEGEEDDIDKFVLDIYTKAPELAVVENISVESADICGYMDFRIIKSEDDDEGFVLVSPDVSICSDCYNELVDPNNKRYSFPFINCTNCGPRFTIIEGLPYDREKTTMREFPMCDECASEYQTIENRRYHAQPNCCHECGPELKLVDSQNRQVDGDAIYETGKKLEQGYIVAVKGLGGFHLACDAMDAYSVVELRKRKHRDQKPFALMARDVDSIRKYAHVSDDEKRILESIRKPIVLLKKNENCTIPQEVAPDNDTIGFMLPYTPLHYLIFEKCSLDVLVMTSANVSDNPVIIDNDEALNKLSDIADYMLLHNRKIATRCDDSVVKVLDGSEYFIRRSRGYAPFPIKLNSRLKPILACGAEQKASFSISNGRYVFLSQHIGDLKNYETLSHYERQVENYKTLFRVEPEIVACDLHPDYLSTRYGEEKYDVKKVYVQHHHAHMASCMADNNLNGDVIGITWDGTGLGTDNTIWGGEILTGGFSGFNRAASFLEASMPGGDRAVKDIYLMAVSYLFKTYGEDARKYYDMLNVEGFDEKNRNTVNKIMNSKLISYKTSSCGRLFDGVSSLIGLCSTASYEGQGAIRLETISKFDTNDVLGYDIIKTDGRYIYDWRATIDDIVNAVRQKKNVSWIGAAFHNTMAEVASKMCSAIRSDTSLDRVVLSGGVFQNNVLLRKLISRLKSMDFKIFLHNRVSTNDEGLSLGQLIIAHYGGGFDVSGSTS